MPISKPNILPTAVILPWYKLFASGVSSPETIYIIGDYPLHVFSMIAITLLITTFLGYLAQMTIDLK